MTSIRDLMTNKLLSNGVWPDEATEVVDEIIRKDNADLPWDEDASWYKPSFLSALWLNVSDAAIARFQQKVDKGIGRYRTGSEEIIVVTNEDNKE